MNLQSKGKNEESIPSAHWADHAALELIALHPDKEQLVCASGISPSGIVHIGNFREAITVDFVVRALRERGKQVRFLYSWDDFDALRKVPVNLPNPELIEENLRRPLAKIPDPYGTEPSYAAHFEKKFEGEISQLGIRPEFIRQHEPYLRGDYLEGIQTALEHEDTIRALLDEYRTEPLPKDWSCLTVFCLECGRDTTEIKKPYQDNGFNYRCKACKKDLFYEWGTHSGAKLLWRIDWPMRWAREGVDFEPGGKDHSAQGGSFATGKRIIETVWKKNAPYYVQYDFVLAKGAGSKLSSSSGNLLTVEEALCVYEPDVVRWIFASRKPNLDFSIAFDLDVLKAYDEFDRTERIAFGAEEAEEKRARYETRIYDLSTVESGFRKTAATLPAQFPFRHLCNILQIYGGDREATERYYAAAIHTPLDRKRFLARAERGWNWIQHFAPEEFRFKLRSDRSAASQHPLALKQVLELLNKRPLESTPEEELTSALFEIIEKSGVPAKAFFQDIYGILIGKPSGPKLASFLKAIGTQRAREILTNGLP